MLHQDRVTVLWDVAQCSLMYILHVLEESSAPIIRVGLSPELGMGVVPRLRMHGAVPPPAPCTFVMCKGTSSPVSLSRSFRRNDGGSFFLNHFLPNREVTTLVSLPFLC